MKALENTKETDEKCNKECPVCPNTATDDTAMEVKSDTATITTDKSVLELAWEELELRNSPAEEQFRLFTNVVERSQPITDKEDVTILTHVTPNKLYRLELLDKFYGGPISVAVYIGSRQDIADFYNFIHKHQNDPDSSLPKHASYHVLMEYDPVPLYPNNRLRNLALQYSDTKYFMSNDVDIVTKPNTHAELKALFPQIKDKLDHRGIFVVPVFERFLPKKKDLTFVTEEYLPRSKEELIKMVKNEKSVSAFYMSNPRTRNIQRAANFTKWYGNDTDIYYNIKYENFFEPYVLALKNGAPQYWEVFRGFGYDKQSWFFEAARMKYKFYVLRDFFLVHRNHAGARDIQGGLQRNKPIMKSMNQYMDAFYNENSC